MRLPDAARRLKKELVIVDFLNDSLFIIGDQFDLKKL